MDTSPEYVKMCREAKEIQRNWKPDGFKHGDDIFAYMDNSGEGYVIAHVADLWSPGEGFEGRTYVSHAWLPRQDQLQEMMNEADPWQLAGDFFSGLNMDGHSDNPEDPYFEQFHSMEQLWLAYVMQHKFGKVWDGEAWTPHLSM